ncbi:ABC transporter permease [Falsigemmobacter intermedius]|uniref:ABC transporter permease n=1 Tax=Falsigemmobacter intermedius TaxID=1553448 RepID=UPI003F0448E0
MASSLLASARTHKMLLPFLLIMLLLVLVAVFAPLIAPHDPASQNLMARLKAPGFESRGNFYLLGTDEIGRDILSRVIYGARVSLLVAFSSVILSGVVGTLLGVIASTRRGWVETLIMRAADIVLSVPALLLAIISVAIIGPSLTNVVVVLALTRWPRYARVAYGQTLSLSSAAFVRLAQFSGVSQTRIILRHILPNIAGALIVVATLEFGLMVLFEASLSFLGLGVQPPTASWGSMLAVGKNYVAQAWWIATIPGLCLFLLVLSVNVIGDHFRDRIETGHR